MSCQHCGATLPETAMFCGECGSAVAPAPRTPASAAAEPSAVGHPVPTAVAAAAPASPPAVRDDTPHCGQCGATMGLADIFCAECGFVAKSVADAYLTETRSIGIRTAPVVVMASPGPSTTTDADAAPSPPAAAELPHAEPTHAEPPHAEPPQVESTLRVDAASDQAARAEPVAAVLDAAVLDAAVLDTEATRLVAKGPAGARFILQFSTGEQAVVTGTGLLGRNPGVQPGERFDHVVSIRDPGRSVSKTHLEFGQDAGEFWVLDRFSGNGSVIRQPDHPAARCEPGRRYRIARGTRVDIGEQFFVVS